MHEGMIMWKAVEHLRMLLTHKEITDANTAILPKPFEILSNFRARLRGLLPEHFLLTNRRWIDATRAQPPSGQQREPMMVGRRERERHEPSPKRNSDFSHGAIAPLVTALAKASLAATAAAMQEDCKAPDLPRLDLEPFARECIGAADNLPRDGSQAGA